MSEETGTVETIIDDGDFEIILSPIENLSQGMLMMITNSNIQIYLILLKIIRLIICSKNKISDCKGQAGNFLVFENNSEPLIHPYQTSLTHYCPKYSLIN